EKDFPRIGFDQACRDLHGGRFARSVRSEVRGDLDSASDKADRIHGGNAGITFMQIASLKHDHRGFSCSRYSMRSDCIGSNRDPRCAGIPTAIRATQLNRTGTPTKTGGSQLFTPNKRLAIRWPRVIAAPTPMTAPARVKRIPCQITIFRISRRSAPSAILTPIS